MDNSVMIRASLGFADPNQSVQKGVELCKAKNQRFFGPKRFATSKQKTSSKLAFESLQTHTLSRLNSVLYGKKSDDLASKNSAIET